jgi:hypothetical protein
MALDCESRGRSPPASHYPLAPLTTLPARTPHWWCWVAAPNIGSQSAACFVGTHLSSGCTPLTHMVAQRGYPLRPLRDARTVCVERCWLILPFVRVC